MHTTGGKKKNKINLIDIKDYNQNGEFYFRTGLKYSDKSQFNIAVRYLKKAVEVDPANADYHFNLACFYSQIKEIRKSNDILKKILADLNPQMTECLFALACNSFDEGNFEEATDYFRKYVAQDAEGCYANECLEALEYIAELKIEENKADINTAKLVEEGRLLARRQFFFGACKKLELAAVLNPEDLEIREELYMLYIKSGALRKALKVIKKEHTLNGHNSFSEIMLMILYNELEMSNDFNRKLMTLIDNQFFESEEFFRAIKLLGKNGFHHIIRSLLFSCLKTEIHHIFYLLLPIALYNTESHADISGLMDNCIKRYPKFNQLSENILKKINEGIQTDSKEKLSYDIHNPEFIKVLRIKKEDSVNNSEKKCKITKETKAKKCIVLKLKKNEENE